jgi:hypothetical protein
MALLESTIESLAAACQIAINNNNLDVVDLYLIHNGSTQKNLNNLFAIQKKHKQPFRNIKIFSGHGNIGYGKGNNLAINESNCSYHLIVNPDILADPESIDTGITYLKQNPDAGMVAPSASGTDNKPHYIAKRHPSIAVLLARALKLKFLYGFLQQQLNAYEYRDKIPSSSPLEIELASGCFMLCKTSALKSIGGFDPRFFMYFEDFDLSIRLRKEGKIVHLPDMHVVHAGGNASRKGWKHICFFCISLCKFLYKN